MSGHAMVMDASSELLPVFAWTSFEAATTATFGMTAQLSPVVGAVRVTVRDSPGAIVPKLQLRTSGFGTVLIEQSAASAPPSVHVLPAGRLSVSVTLYVVLMLVAP